jgi:hypothetical protein
MVFGGQIGTLAGVDSADVAGGAAAAGDVPRSRSRIDIGILLVVFGFIALLGTELVLVLTIPGINYAGADGKAAQAPPWSSPTRSTSATSIPWKAWARR